MKQFGGYDCAYCGEETSILGHSLEECEVKRQTIEHTVEVRRREAELLLARENTLRTAWLGLQKVAARDMTHTEFVALMCYGPDWLRAFGKDPSELREGLAETLDAVVQLDALLDAFYRDTGVWPPGRSMPLALGPDDLNEDERRTKFEEWRKQRKL